MHYLKNSIKLNKYNNIQPYEIALSDKEGYNKFFMGRNSGKGSLLYRKNDFDKKKGYYFSIL
jgi:hypothetical protein